MVSERKECERLGLRRKRGKTGRNHDTPNVDLEESDEETFFLNNEPGWEEEGDVEVPAEQLGLWLPSSYTKSERAQLGLRQVAQIETELREGQANECHWLLHWPYISVPASFIVVVYTSVYCPAILNHTPMYLPAPVEILYICTSMYQPVFEEILLPSTPGMYTMYTEMYEPA